MKITLEYKTFLNYLKFKNNLKLNYLSYNSFFLFLTI